MLATEHSHPEGPVIPQTAHVEGLISKFFISDYVYCSSICETNGGTFSIFDSILVRALKSLQSFGLGLHDGECSGNQSLLYKTKS